jgi:hypothetical protein
MKQALLRNGEILVQFNFLMKLKLSDDELANKVIKNQTELSNSQRMNILVKTDILQQRMKQLRDESGCK